MLNFFSDIATIGPPQPVSLNFAELENPKQTTFERSQKVISNKKKNFLKFAQSQIRTDEKK